MKTTFHKKNTITNKNYQRNFFKKKNIYVMKILNIFLKYHYFIMFLFGLALDQNAHIFKIENKH